MAERIRYQRLPGLRRGLINASSVWLGPDHLLLVHSHRYKEEYKRYYLRDIQGIAVARAGRFHISSRAVLLGLLWFILWMVSLTYLQLTPYVWVSGPLLALVWLYISFDRSCVCRIYTAVSADVLPSVYRTWTARRFLRAVEPRIREAQGALDPAWLEADEPQAGPPVGPPPVILEASARSPCILPPPAPEAEAAPSAAATPGGAVRTPASDLFLASLALGLLLDAAGLRVSAPALPWLTAGAAVAQMLTAVFVFIDRGRGRLRSAMHQVAIAKMIWLTGVFYIGTGLNVVTNTMMIPFVPGNQVLRWIDVGVTLLLLAAGVAVSWRREESTQGILGDGK